MNGFEQDTKYTQQDTTSFSFRKRLKPKKTTHTIRINTDEVDQEIFSSIEAAQSKLEASNTEAKRLEQLIKDNILQQGYLERTIVDLEKENEKLRRGKERASPNVRDKDRQENFYDTDWKRVPDVKAGKCHFTDLFSASIADRMSRSPHRQGRSIDVDIDFGDSDVKRREKAWMQAELRVPELPKETFSHVAGPPHAPTRQQVNIKELKAQMGRLIMDSYAPLQNKIPSQKKDKAEESSNNHGSNEANIQFKRLSELEEALRRQKQDVDAAKARLKTLEEEPFVLYCRRTRE